MRAKGIVICDIDDTIIKANSADIGIWKFKDGKKEKLSTEEFAKDPDKGKPDVEYDYSEFEDPKRIRNSIINGTPILDNLNIIDDYLNQGYDCAFLTARGCEDVIKDVMKSFWKRRDEDGELHSLGRKFKKSLSYAVNDEKYCEIFDGLKDFERKAEILKMISKLYDEVIFIDDDDKNIKAAEKLNLPNLISIKAT